jgi:hypothetical protein
MGHIGRPTTTTPQQPTETSSFPLERTTREKCYIPAGETPAEK